MEIFFEKKNEEEIRLMSEVSHRLFNLARLTNEVLPLCILKYNNIRAAE